MNKSAVGGCSGAWNGGRCVWWPFNKLAERSRATSAHLINLPVTCRPAACLLLLLSLLPAARCGCGPPHLALRDLIPADCRGQIARHRPRTGLHPATYPTPRSMTDDYRIILAFRYYKHVVSFIIFGQKYCLVYTEF